MKAIKKLFSNDWTQVIGLFLLILWMPGDNASLAYFTAYTIVMVLFVMGIFMAK